MKKVKRKILMFLLCVSILTLFTAPTYCMEDSGVISGSESGSDNSDSVGNDGKQTKDSDQKDQENNKNNLVQMYRAPEQPAKGH